MTRNTIPHSIINQLPRSPIGNTRFSVATIVKSFNPKVCDEINLGKIQKYTKQHLTETASTLLIRYYDKVLDMDKLSALSGLKIAALIINKLKSFLPRQCEDCNVDYAMPLDDTDHALRRYCFVCCMPSHNCNPTPPTKANQSWICATCLNAVAGPHIKILKPRASPQRLSSSSTSFHTPIRKSAPLTPRDPFPPLSPTISPSPQTATPSAPTLSQSSSPTLSPPASAQSQMPSPSAPSQSQMSPPNQSPSAPPQSQTSPFTHSSPSAPLLSQMSTQSSPSAQSSPSPQVLVPSAPPSSPNQQPLPILATSTPLDKPGVETSTSQSTSQNTLTKKSHLKDDNCSALLSLAPNDQVPEKSKVSQTPSPKICPYLEWGRCVNGLSGRKNGKCPFPHPKACPPFTSYGSSGRYGCRRGDKCKLWHPSYLCMFSAKHKSCNNAECQYFHHKGCARPTNWQNFPNSPERQRRKPIPLMSIPNLIPYPNRYPPQGRQFLLSHPLGSQIPHPFMYPPLRPHPFLTHY